MHLNPVNLADWVGPLHPHFARIARYPYRANFVRTAAVHRHGGIYLDLDTILLRMPRELIEPPGGEGCFPSIAMNCVFSAKSGAPVMETMHAELMRIMDRRYREPVGGLRADGRIGPALFSWAQREHPQLFANCHRIPNEIFLPTWHDTAIREFILKPYPNHRSISAMGPEIPFLHLYGGGYVPLRLYSAEAVLSSDHPLAFILNTALLRAEEAGCAMAGSPAWAKPGLAAERLQRRRKAPASHPQYDLLEAVEADDTAAVRRLIPKVPQTDYHRARYAEAVFTALLEDRMDALDALLQAPGLDINRIVDWRGCSVHKMCSGGNLLHLAIHKEKPEALAYLLRRTDINPNQRNDFHLTPLMLAAKHNRSEMMARLRRQPNIDDI